MIRVLVADDHPVVRQGIQRILAAAGGLEVVEEAGDAASLLERARAVEHDLVLLDLSMPGAEGLELLKQLKRERPKVPVLILTVSSADQYAVRALRAGASGYLTKDDAPAELVGAIRRVVSGGRYVSPDVAEALASHLADDSETPPHERLSDREFQVFHLIATGTPTREIARRLGLTVKTVSTYRMRIFDKMKLDSPAQLAAYAVRHRLIE
jgi:DNA-binding NarL/FixJ family response regulator